MILTLNSLPPEIALHILAYLPVSSLVNLYSVSRGWNNFLLHYETTVYRQAAFLHGIIQDDDASLDSALLRAKYSQRVLRNVDGWKTLCKIRIGIRNAWNGVAPSYTLPKSMGSHRRESIHRIKVDEQRKLIITTTSMDFPRVEVRDMETGRGLWVLEPSMGRMYAHLEYSNGFLVFDRSNGDREVWRLSDSGSQGNVHPVPCSEIPLEFNIRARPDPFMLEDSAEALKKALRRYSEHLDEDFRPRGCFEPYAVLSSPEDTRAYRFVYPTMMTAAHQRVYMWDVPSARIVEVVSGVQKARLPTPANRVSHKKVPSPSQVGGDGDNGNVVEESVVNDENISELESNIDGDEEELDADSEEEDAEDAYSTPIVDYLLGDITYVDHSPTHIFLAGTHILKIFTRAYVTEDATQSSRLALAIASTKFRYGRWKYAIKLGSRRQLSESSLVRYEVEVSTMDLPPAGRLQDEFKAVHVSPCGSHVVALLNGVRLFVIPHFRKLVGQPEEVLYNHILDVQLSSPAVSKSIYLAYEEGDGGEGRVGVVTSTAVFVITLPYFSLDYSTKNPPVLRISRAKVLMDPVQLANVSCLMMSDTRLFLNIDPWATIGAERRERLLHEWEEIFEAELSYFQENELECYGRERDGFFVKDLPDDLLDLDFHAYSTVCEIDMFPS